MERVSVSSEATGRKPHVRFHVARWSGVSARAGAGCCREHRFRDRRGCREHSRRHRQVHRSRHLGVFGDGLRGYTLHRGFRQRPAHLAWHQEVVAQARRGAPLWLRAGALLLDARRGHHDLRAGRGRLHLRGHLPYPRSRAGHGARRPHRELRGAARRCRDRGILAVHRRAQLQQGTRRRAAGAVHP